MRKIRATRLADGLLILAVALNETDFCWPRLRWLTDEEMIDVAADSEINGPERAKLYRSRADSYEKNPNCCSVERFPADRRLPGAASAAFGCRVALVELFLRQPVEPPHEGPYYDGSMSVSPCGGIGAWWGIDAREGERPAAGRIWKAP